MLLCTACSWPKEAFKKYFDIVENYQLFHQFDDKLFKAPTIAITWLLQADIVQWLESVGESPVAAWFNNYWCDEKGNYTNAAAGYVGPIRY